MAGNLSDQTAHEHGVAQAEMLQQMQLRCQQLERQASVRCDLAFTMCMNGTPISSTCIACHLPAWTLFSVPAHHLP